METIPNEQLCLDEIPTAEATVSDLIEFAHSFNGYEAFGSYERCAEIANLQDHRSLDHLRACLFYEARRWRHFGEGPDPESLAYWHLLVRKIRTAVENRRSPGTR